MAKKYEFTGYLTKYVRHNNSSYGNPCYWGEFTSEEGACLRGKTASNAACAYAFLNKSGRPRKIIYHLTKKGNTIIDFIEIM